ncbi:MAG: Response regulator [Ignavibacteria bacterium]|nr:Response regulator [Ignavibacteria bacterium]
MSKIAIIDDDPDIVEATTMLLESKGYSVVNAGNVEDGIELIKTEIPDLIILDVMMTEPDDGFYLAQKLRKLGNNKPIIMLTSISKATGYDFGINPNLPIQDFLEKPVSSAELISKVEFFLKNS